MIFHEERLNGLQIDIANCAIAIAKAFKEQMNRDTILIWGYRSPLTQEAMWEEGRMKNAAGQWVIINGKNVVTDAFPGLSPHEYACAVDLWIMWPDNSNVDWNYKPINKPGEPFIPSPQNIIANVCKNFPSILWGGNYEGAFKDIDHIEFREWEDVKAGKLKISTYPPQS